jgi:3-oxoacid CoA-transferase subunit B
MSMPRLSRAQIARRAAQDLQPGWYVNLGIGIPTLIANELASSPEIVVHSENGILGMGPEPAEGDRDPDVIDAGKRFATVLPGSCFFDSATSFAMIRGGHIDATVVGAYQVAENGDLANWTVPGRRVGGIGGAADLCASVEHVFVTMQHTAADGTPKIVTSCTFPLTARRAVQRIFTDLAVIEVTGGEGLRLLEVVDGLEPEDVQRLTDAPLVWDSGLAVLAADAG